MAAERNISFDDRTGKVLVYLYGLDDEEEKAAREGDVLTVKENQAAAFMVKGKLAEIAEEPGKYKLNRETFPLVAALKGFPAREGARLNSEIYYLSRTALYDNKWAPKTPVLKEDPILGMVPVRAYGKFAFRLSNCYDFMVEMVEARNITTTYEVCRYLASVVASAFAAVTTEPEQTLRSLMQGRAALAQEVRDRAAKTLEFTGIELLQVLIEGISLPDDVQENMSRQAAAGAKKAKEEDAMYRDAAMMKFRRLRELKSLLDDHILTQEEFEEEKSKILNYPY